MVQRAALCSSLTERLLTGTMDGTLALTSDWWLSEPELGSKRQHPTLSLTQKDKLPTAFSACPEMKSTNKNNAHLYQHENCNQNPTELQEQSSTTLCFVFFYFDQNIITNLLAHIHTVTSSMESWTVFHSIQAWSHTRSVTWRLLHRVTNSASLSLCLEDGGQT